MPSVAAGRFSVKPRPRRRVYEEVLGQLRERPGEWALLGRFKNPASARSTAYNLRHGKVVGEYDPSAFEFTARDHELYARYIG